MSYNLTGTVLVVAYGYYISIMGQGRHKVFYMLPNLITYTQMTELRCREVVALQLKG